MPPSDIRPASPFSARPGWILAAIIGTMLVLRFPTILFTSGMLDEEFFAVPGWTIVKEGIPRIPFLHENDPAAYFYHADVAMFALPPAYFYWQAAVFAVLGPGYAEARMASMAWGIAAILLVYALGKKWHGSARVGLVAAAAFAFSRMFLFTATIARPDMMCGAVCLASLWSMTRFSETRRWRWSAAAGALAGLGLLTHPFAIIACLQIGVWAVLIRQTVARRLLTAAVVTASALAVFSLWGLLIVQYPDEFQRQFFNNVLNRSGPGLLSRVAWPWPSIVSQAILFNEFVTPWQSALLAGGVLVTTLADFRSPDPSRRRALALAWSGIVLLVVFVGVHQNKLYWIYPGALMCICVARAVEVFTERAASVLPNYSRLLRAAAVTCALLMLAPGGGLRWWLWCLEHRKEGNHRHREFAAQLIESLPSDAAFLVDRSYVFDFYLAGRNTTLITHDPNFSATLHPYDLLVVSRFGLDYGLPFRAGGRFVRSFGMKEELFSCYAEVHESPDGAAEPRRTVK